MTRARDLALIALIAFAIAACGGGTTVLPPDDPEPLASVSASVIGYASSDAVAVEGRAQATGDLVAVGVLYGFAGRLDLDLFDRSDIPGSALAPPSLPGCVATVTPANLRVADVIAVANADVSLVLQLRNRPFGATPVGTESVGFIVASDDGSIVATCDFGVQQISYDIDLVAGWNLIGIRMIEYEAGVLERIEARTIDAVPASASWYVAP